MTVNVDNTVCRGDGACVPVCPVGIIEMVPRGSEAEGPMTKTGLIVNLTDPDSCIECGECVNRCPHNVFSL
jgi:ferredoxin